MTKTYIDKISELSSVQQNRLSYIDCNNIIDFIGLYQNNPDMLSEYLEIDANELGYIALHHEINLNRQC